MESMDSRDAVLELILELLGEDEFRAGPSAGLVLQGYLRDSPDTLDTILSWLDGVERAQPLTIRLVKGAYWDHELVQAAQHGWSPPVFERQGRHRRELRAADAPAARRAADASGSRSPRTTCARSRTRSPTTGSPAAPTPTSSCRSCAGSAIRCRPRSPSLGLRVRTYCPVGDLVAGMAYLVRRLLENTSNESFLYEQARGVPLEVLLARPGGTVRADPMKPFTNEPILELRRAPVRAQLRGALEAFDAEPVIQVPVWVGEDTRGGGALISVDPGEPERVVAESAIASEADVDHALDLAARSEWRRTPATARAEVLVRAAAWLRERRLEIAALEVRETAKPWREADADVCEAIDFLEYYARGAVALAERPGRADPAARRAQRAALGAARRRRRHLALELPGRDPARDGRAGAGDRQRGGAQARRAGARVRVHARARAARVRPAGVRAGAAARRGAGRRGAGRRPARAHDRVHRLRAGRAGDRAPRRRARARASGT